MHCEDESLAFIMFIAIMQINNWKRFYQEETPKLFEVTKQIKAHLQIVLPKLDKHIKLRQIMLEPLLASPYLTLFSNLVNLENSIKVLEIFMLMGEPFITNTLRNLLKLYNNEMLKMDQFELQVFLGRKMYA